MTDTFRIEMLPAGFGDSILIEYGRDNATKTVLIDAGPYFTIDKLAQRFKSLIDVQRSLELFVITHVDCDHIDGAITLLQKEQTKLKIEEIWFNNYDHLSNLLGAPEGDVLSTLIKEKETPWNTAFGGRSVSIVNTQELKETCLGGGLKLTILSPTRSELLKLKPEWEKDAEKAHISRDSTEEDALEYLKSKAKKYKVPPVLLGGETPDIESLSKEPYSSRITKENQSSIAFLAEYEGRSCLFSGDASPTILSSSIRTLLKKRKTTKLKLDALKVSHHGSRENTSPELLKMLECKRFLISTNGQSSSKHPHPQSIARVIEINGPNAELVFNYRSPQNEIWDNKQLQNKYFFKTAFPKNSDAGISVTL